MTPPNTVTGTPDPPHADGHAVSAARVNAEVATLRADLGRLLRALAPACPYPVSTDPWVDCDRPAVLRVTWSDRQVLVCVAHERDARQAAARDGDADRTDTPDVERLYTDEALALLLKYWPLALR
jgi:hypothetical protein